MLFSSRKAADHFTSFRCWHFFPSRILAGDGLGQVSVCNMRDQEWFLSSARTLRKLVKDLSNSQPVPFGEEWAIRPCRSKTCVGGWTSWASAGFPHKLSSVEPLESVAWQTLGFSKIMQRFPLHREELGNVLDALRAFAGVAGDF